MSRWLARLAALGDEIGGLPQEASTDGTDKRELLSVLAVSPDADAHEMRAVLADRASARLARLLRWSWPEAEARDAADRLARQDADDDRVTCADCLHYRPGHCNNHRLAGLNGTSMCREWAGQLQRCRGFLNCMP